MYMLKIVITERIEIELSTSKSVKEERETKNSSIQKKRRKEVNKKLQRKNTYKVQDEKEDKVNMSKMSSSVGPFIHG